MQELMQAPIAGRYLLQSTVSAVPPWSVGPVNIALQTTNLSVLQPNILNSLFKALHRRQVALAPLVHESSAFSTRQAAPSATKAAALTFLLLPPLFLFLAHEKHPRSISQANSAHYSPH